MKKIQFSLIVLTFACTACMRSVSINTLRPADIHIPNEVQSIVLVDRTAYEKDAIGIVEGILTGEGINEDQDGIMAMFSSLKNSLDISPRFNVVMASEKIKRANYSGFIS
ncbi:hypothetical protein [Marivirga sp.]|uniref:hypothetical protein n=1 Tax=Marivirga sp. TaxID=2018662 RepID=UPI002D7E2638|nr:hypothetical protein [Marivirga sp.]HET8859306.1 hypothetical protein [Marivirga sp.]